jgi:hypothetical protein
MLCGIFMKGLKYMAVEIVKNHPLPDFSKLPRGRSSGNQYDALEHGDFIPEPDKDKAASRKSAIGTYSKKFGKAWKCKLEKLADGTYRVWVVDPAKLTAGPANTNADEKARVADLIAAAQAADEAEAA